MQNELSWITIYRKVKIVRATRAEVNHKIGRILSILWIIQNREAVNIFHYQTSKLRMWKYNLVSKNYNNNHKEPKRTNYLALNQLMAWQTFFICKQGVTMMPRLKQEFKRMILLKRCRLISARSKIQQKKLHNFLPTSQARDQVQLEAKFTQL